MRRSPWMIRLRYLVDSAWGAALGALVYAAWAVFVNWDGGWRLAFTAGAAHWAMSAFLTYTGTAVMRYCYRMAASKWWGVMLAIGGGLLFTYSLLIGVHHWIGTPHIALTLAAGVLPTLLFCGSYALLLLRTADVDGPDAGAGGQPTHI